MKKILLIAFAGTLVGGTFAILMFKNINKNVDKILSDKNTITAFQVGVFNNYDNALNMKQDYKNAYIYEMNNKYHVFIALYQDKSIINKLYEYYKYNNVSVYLKEIHASNDFINELKKYESLLKETDDYETYIMANNNILESFTTNL